MVGRHWVMKVYLMMMFYLILLNENNGRIKNQYHGNDGPLSVTDCRAKIVQQKYLQAAQEQGYKILDDFNGVEQEGLGVYQVTHINGERCSSARAYLLPTS